MKKSLISLVLTLMLGAGCGEETAPVNVEPPIEDLVIANCYTVQQAVEAFAVANSGVYPSNVFINTNLNGNTVIDLLPGGAKLENPFTGSPTEPTDGFAAFRGATGYSPQINGGVNTDYTISGVGRDYLIIIMTRDTTIAVGAQY